MRDIMMLSDTCEIVLKRQLLKSPRHLTLLVFHIQGESPTDDCEWKIMWGVKRDTVKLCMTFELVFACDRPLNSQTPVKFLDYSSVREDMF